MSLWSYKFFTPDRPSFIEVKYLQLSQEVKKK